MSPRRWLAFTVGTCIALSLVAVRADAETEPAQNATVWTGLVPGDAFFSLVAYPRRVLAQARLADVDAQMLAQEVAAEIGFSPFDLEQVAFLVGPLTPQKDPQVAVICRFSKAVDRDALLKAWFPNPEHYLAGGHVCVRSEQTAKSHDSADPAICFLDDRTFVYASQNWLPAVLGAKDAKSKLISALGSTDATADLTAIFTTSDSAKDFGSWLFPAEEFPEPFKPLSELTDWIAAAKLTVRTSPEISLKLTALANDKADAKKFADLVKTLRQYGQQMLPVALPVSQSPKESAEEREMSAYARKLAEKFLDQFVAHQSGKQVIIEIDHLGTVASVFDKLILPSEHDAHAVAAPLQSLNNLRLIAQAMRKHVAAERVFPANAIYSKAGKPLLSWRVAMLPSLGEEKLYKEFHLDEPWDSEHNKALIAKMPDVYKSGGKPLAEGMTRFVVPVGKDTMFDGDKGIAVSDVTDGLSNTILALEVGDDKAVEWTKPEDMKFDPQKPMAGLGTVERAIHIVLADGSAITFRKEIAPEKFRDLILRNDGHRVEHVSEITHP